MTKANRIGSNPTKTIRTLFFLVQAVFQSANSLGLPHFVNVGRHRLQNFVHLYSTQENNNENNGSNFRQNQLHLRDMDRPQSFTTSRRDALATAVALVILSSPLKSYASTVSNLDTEKISLSLEPLNLGVEGEWIEQKDFNVKNGDTEKLIIPPSFVTYATRFLIKYDEGISAWWNEKLNEYSLFPIEEIRNKLDKDFGCMARSVQVALEEYVVETDGTAALIQERFEELANLFLETYDRNSINGNVMRQIGILFTILPKEFQPTRFLKKAVSISPNVDSILGESSVTPQPLTASIDSVNQQMTQLLKSEYRCTFDKVSNSFTLSPSLAGIGDNDKYGESALTTIFGPLSYNPLKRDRPNLSLYIYSLFGISGAAGCTLTHTVVVPFDVVKTRMQTNPGSYKNMADGTLSIANSEGIRALSLGFEATIVGYCWYGLSVYPSYAFFKWYFENSLLPSAFAAAHVNDIALVAGALAAVLASIGLTPMEACRIRTVANPEVYRDIGLLGTMGVISSEDPDLGWKNLYAGFPSLLTRQVIFGSVKFLAFERACDAIYSTSPDLRDATFTALGVTLAAGAFSGALSSVVSQPADSILTYVAKNAKIGGELGIIESAQLMVKNEGVSSLFRGLGSRCFWASCIISGQFFLYDIFRNFFGINSEDLIQVFHILIKNQSIATN